MNDNLIKDDCHDKNILSSVIFQMFLTEEISVYLRQARIEMGF